ncbi:hypothetical protein EHN46_21920 [Salmonella enterica]|nr:hypothetical protein [Salmonella enterica]EBB7908449.1 hypothetical protein [Salmonella enterica]EBK3282653.1 hypothetical protein [Salmonella enterica]
MENLGYRLGMLTRRFMRALSATEVKPQPQTLKEEYEEEFKEESGEEFELYDDTQDGYDLGPDGPGIYVDGFKVTSLDGKN